MADTPRILRPDSEDYPEILKQHFGHLAAPQLSYIGELALLKNSSVGFCGSRKVSELGISIAMDTAGRLSQHGITITSGYARGVDTATHLAALQNDGTTIIVLSEGISNFRIKKEIKEFWDISRVLVISQFPDKAVWRADRAMERNDLIVLLSMATVVIEAGKTGGTLNAGMKALKFNKNLFVINYKEYTEENYGNKTLIDAGGKSLNYSRIKNGVDVNIILDRINYIE